MTPDEVRKAAADDYGQYVAKDAVFIDGVRAFNKGDAVPASHVRAGLVSEDDVEKTTTKAGRAVLAETQEG